MLKNMAYKFLIYEFADYQTLIYNQSCQTPDKTYSLV